VLTGREDEMPKGLSAVDIHRLARIGAAARLAELEREIAGLRKAFPGLKSGSESAPAPAAAVAAVPKAASKASRRGRRKPMSAAEKRAVSERMKRYWAERKKS
jgi:hypothetical protein